MPPPASDSKARLSELIRTRFALDEPPAANHSLIDTSMIDTSLIEIMLAHRSCRTYRSDRVDDELIELLLAATAGTPSKSDLQQWAVVAVDDPAVRTSIAELIPSMPWIVQAPKFFVFCGDSRRIRAISAKAGFTFANDHLDAFLNAASDASMHLSSFIWAAESLGLGTCPISVIRNHIEEVATLLELPEHVFPLAGLCVGWPERLERLSPRLPLSVTVHRNRYDDSKALVDIADYDRRRLERRPKDGAWSAAKAAMVARSERSQLARFLRSRGFGLD